MADPLCTPLDGARLIGPLDDAQQQDQVEALCTDVSALIRARLPLIDQWIAGGAISVEVVRAIACQVVARVLTTTQTGGVGIRSEQHPEYSYELTASAAAGLNLTKAEIAALTPTVGRSRPFSIIPG